LISRICQNPDCGKEFKTIPSRIKTGKGKYCSKQCGGLMKRIRIKRICQNCGDKFEVVPSRIKKGGGKFCSKQCYSLAQKKKVKRICKKCGEEFEVKFSVVKKGQGNFCSISCGLSGENSSFWKGGISYEPYCVLFNRGFKERVREFWGRKCGISGITEKENGRKLDVHHVNYDKQSCCNTNIPLFIPLSKKYHKKTNGNRNYWEEMLTNYIMIWFNGECYLPKEDLK
jgi:hypothetical protein